MKLITGNVYVMDESQTTTVESDHCWPGFLDLVDSSPKWAAEQFYMYVCSLFRTAPPRILRSIPADKHPDLIHDIVVHCIREDFRVLRQYRNRGRPFAVWFYFIARHLILDWIEKQGREPSPLADFPEGNSHDLPNIASGTASAEIDAQMREMLEAVNHCLDRIGNYCRSLLRMAGDEWLPREMAQVLGLPKDKAKKVSNDLGYCRKKLENLLVEYGMDIDDLKRRGNKL